MLQTSDHLEPHPAAASSFGKDCAAALHCFAGLVLFLFAASHIAFLRVADNNHLLPNPVFPFITGWWMYLLAALLELGIGSCCLVFRGRSSPNIVVLTFIATILWYRWAFHYNGGSDCNCIGLLGRLLGLNRAREKVVSITVLVFLGLTTVPYLLFLLHLLRHQIKGRAPHLIVICGLAAAGSSPAASPEEFEIQGVLEAANYNPKTGAMYSNNLSRSVFTTVRSGTAWKVCVTNAARPAWWAVRFYDGTNTFVIRPSGGNFWGRTNLPRQDLQVVTISGTVHAIALDADPLAATLPCLTFGMAPQSFPGNGPDTAAMPIPWTVVRDNPSAWGYRWLVTSAPGAKFLQSFQVLRDSSLDLPQRQEFLRPEIDYPETTAWYDAYMKELLNRKAVSNGQLRADYECTAWFETNGMKWPQTSELRAYLPPVNGLLPARIFKLAATNFLFRPVSGEVTPAAVVIDTTVLDYRYKRVNKTRVFKYAEYLLKPGEPWKAPNDPVLVAQATDWLKNGREFTEFADTGKRWFSWLLLALVIIPAFAMLTLKAKKTTKTQGKQ
jgi:hypothetical protein